MMGDAKRRPSLDHYRYSQIVMPISHHHTSIKTADIFKSIAFYEALGFEVTERFSAGITLACWMHGAGTNLELMQVPEPKNITDPFKDEHYVGYYHLSFRVDDLTQFLQELLDKLGKLKLLLPPRSQAIGDHVYQVAFIADPDGLPIELMQRIE